MLRPLAPSHALERSILAHVNLHILQTQEVGRFTCKINKIRQSVNIYLKYSLIQGRDSVKLEAATSARLDHVGAPEGVTVNLLQDYLTSSLNQDLESKQRMKDP